MALTLFRRASQGLPHGPDLGHSQQWAQSDDQTREGVAPSGRQHAGTSGLAEGPYFSHPGRRTLVMLSSTQRYPGGGDHAQPPSKHLPSTPGHAAAAALVTALPLTVAGLTLAAPAAQAAAPERPWVTVVNNGQYPPGSAIHFNSYNQPSVSSDGVVVFRGRTRAARVAGAKVKATSRPCSRLAAATGTVRGVYSRDMGTAGSVVATMRRPAAPCRSRTTPRARSTSSRRSRASTRRLGDRDPRPVHPGVDVHAG